MILESVRASLLGSFPAGTPVLIAATEPGAFAALVAARSDPATALTALTAAFDHPALAATPHVVLEGLDDVEDPPALLAALRDAAPQARLFALVANGAHVRGLGAFLRGRPPARAHPLVEGELHALFTAGGWQVVAVTPVRDPSLPSPSSYPSQLADGDAVSVRVDDAEMFARLATAAFVVVADPR